MEIHKHPAQFELESIEYAIGQAANLQEAKEALRTFRRYLEIELTQYPQSN